MRRVTRPPGAARAGRVDVDTYGPSGGSVGRRRRALVTAMGGGWTPAKLRGNGLALWLEAAYGAAWVDLSGNGVVIGEGGSPDYTTLQAPSGKPAILFDGSTDYFTADGVASVFSGTDKAHTLITVFRNTGTAVDTRCWFSYAKTGSTNPFAYFRRGTAAVSYNKTDDAGTAAAVITAAAFSGSNVWYVWSEVCTGTAVSRYRNGTKIADAVAQDVGAFTCNLVRIGVQYYNAAYYNYWDNGIAAVLLMSRAVTTDELNLIQGYFSKRYGIAVVSS